MISSEKVNVKKTENKDSRDSVKDTPSYLNSRCSRLTTRGSMKSEQTRLPSQGFINGEAVSNSGVRSLSALYRPKFHKYPTFPSIYETKYQQDFQHTPFPVSPPYRPTNVRSDFSRFPFASSVYNEQFHPKNVPRSENQIPGSSNRRHNPQPKIRIVFNDPNKVHWIWSSIKKDRTFSREHAVEMKNAPMAYHRWNSR